VDGLRRGQSGERYGPFYRRGSLPLSGEIARGCRGRKEHVGTCNGNRKVAGFPQTIPNATAKLKEGIDLEIPLSPEQKAKIEQSALGEGTVLTYANLVLTLASPPAKDAVSPSPSPRSGD
jgi:hypothetical protein